MIIKHTIQGSKDTTMTDFQCIQNGNELTLNMMHYKNGIHDIESELGEVVIPFSSDSQYDKQVTIYLVEDGTFVVDEVLHNGEDVPSEISDMVDRLVWFNIPADTIDFDSIEVNVIEVIV